MVNKISVDTKEVKAIEKSIAPVISKADKIVVIKSAEDMEKATVVLSELNKYADSLKAEKKKLTTPANDTLKAIKALFMPLEERVLPKIESIRAAMSAYQTEQVRLAREEEAKIAGRVGEGKGKLKVETAMKKIDEVERPAEKIATDAGGLRFREMPKLKVMDETMIPRDYLVPDEKKILDALKAGTPVAGCEIELVQVPINSR